MDSQRRRRRDVAAPAGMPMPALAPGEPVASGDRLSPVAAGSEALGRLAALGGSAALASCSPSSSLKNSSFTSKPMESDLSGSTTTTGHST